MKVFLTGNLGYVGTVLHKRLLENNHKVIGCDIGYFPKSWNDEEFSTHITLKKDIRDITKEDLVGCDTICHLAGLSNDPMGEINQSLTNEINFLESLNKAIKNEHIVNFEGVYMHQLGKFKQYFIILELCEGTLTDLMQDNM